MTPQPEHDPLADLAAAGVAVWLDDLSRGLLAGDGLQLRRTAALARTPRCWP